MSAKLTPSAIRFHHLAVILLPAIFVSEATGQEKQLDPRWNWQQVLRVDRIANEIDALDYQVNEARQIVDDETSWFHRTLLERPRRGSSDREEGNSVPQMNEDSIWQEFRERLNGRLSETFLPHQIQRLNQLAYWIKLNQRSGFAHGVTSEPVKSILGISERESKELKNAAKPLELEFNRKLFNLRKKYRQLLSKELTVEQREKLQQALGDDAQVGTRYFKF